MKKSLVLITAIVTIVGAILFGGLNNTKQSNITDDEGLAKEFVLQTYGEGMTYNLPTVMTNLLASSESGMAK